MQCGFEYTEREANVKGEVREFFGGGVNIAKNIATVRARLAIYYSFSRNSQF